MNYIRTTSGSMIAIGAKTNTVIAVNKQSPVVKPARKTKKAVISVEK